MKIPIYLSHATPHTQSHERFLNSFREAAARSGLECVFVTASDLTSFDTIRAIKKKIETCYGLAAIACERRLLVEAISKNNADIPGAVTTRIAQLKETTPYIQIETAIALTYELPVMVIKENGMLEEGVLEPYSEGINGPSFDIEDEEYFSSEQFGRAIEEFSAMVRACYDQHCCGQR